MWYMLRLCKYVEEQIIHSAPCTELPELVRPFPALSACLGAPSDHTHSTQDLCQIQLNQPAHFQPKHMDQIVKMRVVAQ